MDRDERLSGYWNRALRRRRLIGSGLSLAGSAAFLAACGGSSNNNGAKVANQVATTVANTGAASATSAANPAASATRAAAATTAGAATAAAATTSVASTAAAAAGQTPIRGGYYRSSGGAQVYDSVDVHRAAGDPTLVLGNYILNKLIWYANPDTGELAGDLAESYETPDAINYTFKLRQGVKWQNIAPANGREFVADDVKWHIERQAKGKLLDGADASDFFRKPVIGLVTNVETPDKYTVKMTLSQPIGWFLTYLAAYTSTIPNREATEKFEKDYHTLNEGAMIGTGPFQLVQWRAQQKVLFKRNPDYFRKDQPNIDGVIDEAIFEDPNAQRAAFEQKQIDAIGPPDDSVTKAILDAHKGQTYEVLSGVGNTVSIWCNMNQQFKDIRLVQAVNQAIDRRQLIQSLHAGLGQVSGRVVWLQEGYAIPPDELIKLPGYRTDRAAEIKDARALWQAGGGPALGEVDFKVPQTWLAVYPSTQEILVKMLNEGLGTTQIKSTNSDYNTEIIPNLFNGKFPNWFGWTATVNGPDPRQALFTGLHSKSTTNYNHANNPDLDQLLTDAAASVDQAKAVATLRKAQDIIMANAQFGVIYLYNYIFRSAVWNYVHGNYKTQASAGKAAISYNLPSQHLLAKNVWINPADPAFQGRPPASI